MTKASAGAGQEKAAAAIEAALADLGLGYESPQPGSYLVRLEGQHKLATMTWLIAGTHSLHVEAFFCRQPDENHAQFYRFLLERNGRMYGVHFALDPAGSEKTGNLNTWFLASRSVQLPIPTATAVSF